MSTTTQDRTLYAVPDVPPSTKSRFAALLSIWGAARRAFDKALSLPRSATRWAISLFHRWAATGGAGVLSWLSAQARNGAGLFRAIGVLPSALAVLSTPPIAAAAARVARLVGTGLLRLASAAWSGLKSLLSSFGSTGTRIAEGLGRAGTQVAEVLRAVAMHPVMAHLAQAVKATLALVRPVGRGFVTHRLLGALVPMVWIRAVVELLVMPFLVDSGLAGKVQDSMRNPSTNPNQANSDDAEADRLASTGTDSPTPGGDVPAEDAVQPGQTLNRASRRAQEREDARARRSRRHAAETH